MCGKISLKEASTLYPLFHFLAKGRNFVLYCISGATQKRGKLIRVGQARERRKQLWNGVKNDDGCHFLRSCAPSRSRRASSARLQNAREKEYDTCYFISTLKRS